VFNSVSHANETANIIMATVGMIFLPLTFLTG
jgi:Mg2+ and Co2+ transporter CorA